MLYRRTIRRSLLAGFAAVLGAGLLATGPLPAGAATGCNLSGLWRSPFGLMRLAMTPTGGISNPGDLLQSADAPLLDDGVEATLAGSFQGREGEGRIDGAVVGDRVELRWYRPESYAPPEDAGDGWLELAGDCDDLAGAWRHGFEGDFDQPWRIQRVESPAATGADDAEEVAWRAMQTRVDDRMVAYGALRDGLDDTAFDIAALAAALAADPAGPVEAALARMAEVRYEPYEGILRGARGALMANAGNAWDQSLMLQALLVAAGIPARIVTAPLTDAAAMALVDAAATVRPPPPVLDAPAPPAHLLAALGMTADRQAELAREGAAGRQAVIDTVAADARRHADVIAALLRDEDALPAADSASQRAALAAVAARHVWVQAEVDGDWTGLDPAFGDRGDPDRLAGPAAVVEAPDDALYHRASFVVSIERREGGALVEERVGGWTVRVADIMRVGVPVFRFRNAPFDLPSVAGETWGPEDAAAGVQRIADAMRQETGSWRPTLILSTGETDLGEGFDLSGNLLADDYRVRLANETREAVEGAMQGATSVLGGLFGDQPAEVPQETVLTGQWFEVRLSGPGRAERSFRRAILDRIGAAARAAGTTELLPEMADDEAVRYALMTGYDVLVSGGAIHAEWRKALSLDAYMANREVIGRAVDLRFARRPLGADVVAGLVDWPESLFLFEPLRRAAALAAGAGEALPLVQTGADAVAHRRTVGGDGAGNLVRGFGFDIFQAGRTPVPAADTPDDALLAARLRDGALQTALERELVDAWVSDICPDCDVRVVENTTTIVDAALAAGIPLRVFRPGGAGDPAAAGLPAEAVAGIARARAAGQLVVVPESPVALEGADRLAWWRIDAATGDTLGMLPGRGGEGYTEYIIIVGLIIFGDNGATMLEMFDRCVGFDPGAGSHRRNDDGTYTWYPPTGPSTSGRGFFNCLGCALLSFTCPGAGMVWDYDCWTSTDVRDYPTCASSMGGG